MNLPLRVRILSLLKFFLSCHVLQLKDLFILLKLSFWNVFQDVEQQLRVLCRRDRADLRLAFRPLRDPPVHQGPLEAQPQELVLDPAGRISRLRRQLPGLRRPHHRTPKGLGLVSSLKHFFM